MLEEIILRFLYEEGATISNPLSRDQMEKSGIFTRYNEKVIEQAFKELVKKGLIGTVNPVGHIMPSHSYLKKVGLLYCQMKFD